MAAGYGGVILKIDKSLELDDALIEIDRKIAEKWNWSIHGTTQVQDNDLAREKRT